MIILGIDPGSIICGYGVVEKNKNKFSLIEYGVVKAKNYSDLLHLRLKEIYLRINSVVERTKPDIAAFETIFFSKNVQSIVKLSHARSAAILAASMNNIDIAEYSPKEVKKSVTGRGNASKEQVQFMVKSILNITETLEFFDASDALAVALCHGSRNLNQSNNCKSWDDFIKKNPNRVCKSI